MTTKTIGTNLFAAALAFFLAWLLMPGVGVTDAKQIFALVSAHRPQVALSVLSQLLSAVLYVPALLGLASHRWFGKQPSVRLAAGLLLVGAMGSAADAVLHLLAYAMTAPGLATDASAQVMAFMQGTGLVLLAPLILCFFLGGGLLSFALANAGIVSRRSAQLHWVALGVAVLGGQLASHGMLSGRLVGLAALGCVSAAQAWLGSVLLRYDPQAHNAAQERALGERPTVPSPPPRIQPARR